MRRHRAFTSLWPLALALLSACATEQIGTSPPPTLAAVPARDAGPYVLQPGDAISVKFYSNPELNEDLVVRPDGMVSLQLIGAVPAAGRSPEAFSAELAKLYATEVSNPRVTVIVRSLATPPIYIGGEVGHQGELQFVKGLTLYQAIQSAGGFRDTALREQVILIRGDEYGHPKGNSIDTRPIQDGLHPEDDIPLKPYDVVFVPKTTIAKMNVFVDQYMRQMLPINPLSAAAASTAF